MLIFLDEERAYLSWVSHHHDGFVLDWLRKPTRKRPTLHRATCPEIRRSKSKRTHWTTGRHLKACSLDLEELTDWARAESGAEPVPCGACAPDHAASSEELAAAGSEDAHLTRLGEDIVDYVLEAAVIHLDLEDDGYSLTVGDVADYVDKTPGQVTPALLRLVTDGYLRVEGEVPPGATLESARRVYPTEKALRTLPAFEKLSKRRIRGELKRLEAGE